MRRVRPRRASPSLFVVGCRWQRVVLLVLVPMLFASAASGAPAFRTAFTPSGTSAVAADLDGDGRKDLVVLDDCTLRRPTSRGEGTGTPLPGCITNVDAPIIAADTNRDSRDEILIPAFSREGTGYEVLRARPRPNGRFALDTIAPKVPDQPDRVAWGDVTGDGRPDLVVGFQSGPQPAGIAIAVGRAGGRPGPFVVADRTLEGRVLGIAGGRVILAAPKGVFAVRADASGRARVVRRTPARSIEKSVLARYDEDDRPDVITAGGRGRLTVRSGRPGGAFGPGRVVARFADAEIITNEVLDVADADGNGRPDVALGYSSGGFVRDSRARGGVGAPTGGVQLFVQRRDGRLATGLRFRAGRDGLAAVAIGDVDDDGRADLVAPGGPGFAGALLLGMGERRPARLQIAGPLRRISPKELDVPVRCVGGAGRCLAVLEPRRPVPGDEDEGRDSSGLADVLPGYVGRVRVRTPTRVSTNAIRLTLTDDRGVRKARAQVKEARRIDRQRACSPASVVVPPTDGAGVRVFYPAGDNAIDTVACRIGEGRWTVLNDGPGFASPPFATDGRRVAYASAACDPRDQPCSETLYIRDLAIPGRILSTAHGGDDLSDLTMSPQGGVAWIVPDSVGTITPRGARVVRWDVRGVRVLATGTGIDRRSLRRTPGGHAVTWMQDSAERSASLGAAPRRSTRGIGLPTASEATNDTDVRR